MNSPTSFSSHPSHHVAASHQLTPLSSSRLSHGPRSPHQGGGCFANEERDDAAPDTLGRLIDGLVFDGGAAMDD
ncbi:hypothetical protein Droror1_Dr00016217 [Drosera rotundifolia]